LIGVGVAIGIGVGLGRGVGVAIGIGVGLGRGVGVAIGVGPGVPVGEGVGVAVGEGVGVAVGAGVGVGVGVGSGAEFVLESMEMPLTCMVCRPAVGPMNVRSVPWKKPQSALVGRLGMEALPSVVHAEPSVEISPVTVWPTLVSLTP